VTDVEDWTGDIHQGDAVELLASMPPDSVHMAMCSPPYYGLRDYGVEEQIGLEDSLGAYIESLVAVGDELRRVLRDDGSWWLNLGDSFAGSWGAQSKDDEANHRDRGAYPGKNPARTGALRRKTKMLVPHRVAIALQDAGWIVRSDAVWKKPNPMPHPVKDRLNEHKEFLFHLTPEPDYWFDLDAIREPHKDTSIRRTESSYKNSGTPVEAYPDRSDGASIGTEPEDALHPNGKNPGDVLEVSVKPFPEAHFAVYPPELCEMPVQATAPERVCAACGTPYERATEPTQLWERDASTIDRPQARRALELFRESDLDVEHLKAIRAVGFGDGDHGDAAQGSMDRVAQRQHDLATEAKDVLGGYFREFVASPDREHAGWTQTCSCATDATEAGVVLDPFAGAGTTCLVAKDHGRRFIGIELNADYVALAQKRVGVAVDEPERLLDDGQATLPMADGGEGR
jgi:DNA modification methylase